MRVLLLALSVPLLLSRPVPAADRPIDFAHDVLPLLKARCAECHTAGKYRGGLSLDTREAMLRSKSVVPGKSAASPLLARLTSADPKERMPPKGPALTPKEVATLRAWIDEGANWEAGFSFARARSSLPLKLRAVTLPAAAPARDHPVDRLVGAHRDRKKLGELAPADDLAFLRRVTLDLVGLLPTPAEADAFLADRAPDRRAKVVRGLLARPQAYADHWLTFWNDLLRNDYAGTGFIDGGRKPITAWLYRSLLENKPYDRFVRELISPVPGSEGFVHGIRWRGVVNASQVVELQFSQNVGQVFLGINMKCASCHDSFIDHWKLDDAYALAAVVADRPLAIHRCDKPTGATAKARFLFPELGGLDASRPRAERQARLAELLTHRDNGRFSRTIVNRVWQRLLGRGIVHPVDVMEGEPWDADLLDHLAGRFVEDGYDLRKLLEYVTTSRAYQARAVATEQPADSGAGGHVFAGPLVRRLTAEQFVDAVWAVTGTAPAKPAAGFEGRGPGPVRAALVVADPLLYSLGRPHREQVVSTRPEELSTLVALDLANGQPLASLLDRGAKALRKKHPGAKPDELIATAWRAALGRAPAEAELPAARALLGESVTDDGVSDLLWTLFLLPEFQLIR